MPRILVVSDTEPPQITMNELVTSEIIDSEHAAHQVVERLAWGLADAEQIEQPAEIETVTHLPTSLGVLPYGELTG